MQHRQIITNWVCIRPDQTRNVDAAFSRLATVLHNKVFIGLIWLVIKNSRMTYQCNRFVSYKTALTHWRHYQKPVKEKLYKFNCYIELLPNEFLRITKFSQERTLGFWPNNRKTNRANVAYQKLEGIPEKYSTRPWVNLFPRKKTWILT